MSKIYKFDEKARKIKKCRKSTNYFEMPKIGNL